MNLGQCTKLPKAIFNYPSPLDHGFVDFSRLRDPIVDLHLDDILRFYHAVEKLVKMALGVDTETAYDIWKKERISNVIFNIYVPFN